VEIKLEIRFNEKRALKVFKTIGSAWVRGEGIFKDVVLPQDLYPVPVLPERDYANWFFYASLPMRGGIVSEDPFKWLRRLKEVHPGLFRPEEVVAKWSPEKIQNAFIEITPNILNGNGTGMKGAGALSYKMFEHSKAWFENSVVLAKYWKGDIRQVYLGCEDFEEAFARIDHKKTDAGLKGTRRKIFSLNTIFLQEKDLIPIFPTPIPVDFHALRILFSTNIVFFSPMGKQLSLNPRYPHLEEKVGIRVSEGLIDPIAKWTQKFLYKNGLSHLDVSPAIWTLSRLLCAEHFQNSSKGDGAKLVKTPNLVKNPGLWPKNYKDPCFYCPIEKWCQWAIPAALYYRWGLLVKLGKRVDYPAQKLPGVDWEKFLPYKSRKGGRNNKK
jgi:hypothetical protein